jgi:hypothetical protein
VKQEAENLRWANKSKAIAIYVREKNSGLHLSREVWKEYEKRVRSKEQRIASLIEILERI